MATSEPNKLHNVRVDKTKMQMVVTRAYLDALRAQAAEEGTTMTELNVRIVTKYLRRKGHEL